MPIDTKHPEYLASFPSWVEAAAALSGQRYIKDAGVLYLPPTSGMIANWATHGSKAYDAYKLRARFYDIASESLEGVLGVMFGKDPLGNIDEIVTNNGLSVLALAREVSRSVDAKGRHILVVEAPADGGIPYIAQYPAEALINWKVDENYQLTLAVFVETVANDINDPYEHDSSIQYRVYTPGRVQVFDYSAGLVEDYALSISVVPVICIGAVDCSPSCDKAPITRIVDCAFSAYRCSADYHQARFGTGQATFWYRGPEDQYQKIVSAGLGAGAALPLGEDAQNEVGYVQISQDVLESLKKPINEELELAAQYAMKLIQANGAESGTALAIRDTAQKSAVATMADSVSLGINLALNLRAKWGGLPEPEEFVIQIQDSQQAEATMIQALSSTINSAQNPRSVLWDYMRKTGMSNKSDDELQSEIETGTAGLIA